jgi:L-2-hydroxyglutarate oxidase LhgO
MSGQRIGIVGAGILGLAVARRLTEVSPDAKLTVFDKEPRVAVHQTGHNSGVVHAGIYYAPGSLKAQLCARGRTLLQEYCGEHGLAYEECGKLIIARDAGEVSRLDELERRAEANSVPGVRRLTGAQIGEIEPHARGVAALHSPHTSCASGSKGSA